MADTSVNERLAVLETQNERQHADIKEILDEIKNVSAFIYECKPKLDALTDADLDNRITKVETRQKVYISIGTVIISSLGLMAILKDKIMSMF